MVNRLCRLVQALLPVDQQAGASGIRNDERHSLDLGALLLPQIDPKRALRRERRPEHDLSGHQGPGSHLFRRPVSDHGHIMAVIKQANPELQPRLPGTNDQKPSHRPAPSRAPSVSYDERLNCWCHATRGGGGWV